MPAGFPDEIAESIVKGVTARLKVLELRPA
jgi:hypothetical protein